MADGRDAGISASSAREPQLASPVQQGYDRFLKTLFDRQLGCALLPRKPRKGGTIVSHGQLPGDSATHGRVALRGLLPQRSGVVAGKGGIASDRGANLVFNYSGIVIAALGFDISEQAIQELNQQIPELNITVNAPTPEEIQSEQADSGN